MSLTHSRNLAIPLVLFNNKFITFSFLDNEHDKVSFRKIYEGRHSPDCTGRTNRVHQVQGRNNRLQRWISQKKKLNLESGLHISGFPVSQVVRVKNVIFYSFLYFHFCQLFLLFLGCYYFSCFVFKLLMLH